MRMVYLGEKNRSILVSITVVGEREGGVSLAGECPSRHQISARGRPGKSETPSHENEGGATVEENGDGDGY